MSTFTSEIVLDRCLPVHRVPGEYPVRLVMPAGAELGVVCLDRHGRMLLSAMCHDEVVQVRRDLLVIVQRVGSEQDCDDFDGHGGYVGAVEVPHRHEVVHVIDRGERP